MLRTEIFFLTKQPYAVLRFSSFESIATAAPSGRELDFCRRQKDWGRDNIATYSVTKGASQTDVSTVQKSTRRKSLPLEEKVSALADGWGVYDSFFTLIFFYCFIRPFLLRRRNGQKKTAKGREISISNERSSFFAPLTPTLSNDFFIILLAPIFRHCVHEKVLFARR